MWRKLNKLKQSQITTISAFCTHPEDNVVAEEQIFVPTADFCIRISVIVHLLSHGVCREEEIKIKSERQLRIKDCFLLFHSIKNKLWQPVPYTVKKLRNVCFPQTF